MDLVISPEARNDLSTIWLYIARDYPGRADRFVERLLTECRLLASHPSMGRARDELAPGLRGFPVGRYVVFYRVRAEHLEVVRLLSAYRDLDQLF